MAPGVSQDLHRAALRAVGSGLPGLFISTPAPPPALCPASLQGAPTCLLGPPRLPGCGLERLSQHLPLCQHPWDPGWLHGFSKLPCSERRHVETWRPRPSAPRDPRCASNVRPALPSPGPYRPVAESGEKGWSSLWTGPAQALPARLTSSCYSDIRSCLAAHWPGPGWPGAWGRQEGAVPMQAPYQV